MYTSLKIKNRCLRNRPIVALSCTVFASADESWKRVGDVTWRRNVPISDTVGVQFTLWTFQSNNRNTVYERASPLKWKEQRRQILRLSSFFFNPRACFKGQLPPRILYREYWTISRGTGLSWGRMIRLLTHPSPVSKLSLFLGLPVCRRERGVEGWSRSRIIKPQKRACLL